jgi:hypothetical protein
VRPPRLVLDGPEREATLALIAERLACRPTIEPVRAAPMGGRQARATPASAAR